MGRQLWKVSTFQFFSSTVFNELILVVHSCIFPCYYTCKSCHFLHSVLLSYTMSVLLIVTK